MFCKVELVTRKNNLYKNYRENSVKIVFDKQASFSRTLVSPLIKPGDLTKKSYFNRKLFSSTGLFMD